MKSGAILRIAGGVLITSVMVIAILNSVTLRGTGGLRAEGIAGIGGDFPSSASASSACHGQGLACTPEGFTPCCSPYSCIQNSEIVYTCELGSASSVASSSVVSSSVASSSEASSTVASSSVASSTVASSSEASSTVASSSVASSSVASSSVSSEGDVVVCGDNETEGEEACDGTDIMYSDCEDWGADYYPGGIVTCTACVVNLSGCRRCGDGVRQENEGETCDDGKQGTASICAPGCQSTEDTGGGSGGDTGTTSGGPSCGDFAVQYPEQCDKGPTGGSGCSPSCQLEGMVSSKQASPIGNPIPDLIGTCCNTNDGQRTNNIFYEECKKSGSAYIFYFDPYSTLCRQIGTASISL